MTHINFDSNIKKYRMGNVKLSVFNDNNKPLINREVTIEQLDHKFLFGCSISHSNIIEYVNNQLNGTEITKQELHNKKMLDLFNYVTLLFYWVRFERERGAPDTKRILNTARWFKDHGFTLKGHPLCWHTITAEWLLDLEIDEIIKAQQDRIKREVADFKGLVEMWDLVNEAVIMPNFEKAENGITKICKKLGRFELLRRMFDTARSVNPDAKFLLCDFDNTEAFEILIEGCLEAGIKPDIIGLHTHMHQGYYGIEKTLKIIERFTQFKIPFHLTEISLVSGHLMTPPPEIVDLNDYKIDYWPTTPEGEERQAHEAEELYKLLFSHPDVHAITWWEFADGGWIKAPAGLIHEDYSNKPVYDVLYNLIKKEWWLSPVKLNTNNNGIIDLNGFFGRYSLSFGNKKTIFDIEPGVDEVFIKL